MKKGTYIDYNILLACLSQKPTAVIRTAHTTSAFKAGSEAGDAIGERKIA